jgi:hypothetical protein
LEAKRAFDATMGMKKIDVAAIKAARLTFHQKGLTGLSRSSLHGNQPGLAPRCR